MTDQHPAAAEDAPPDDDAFDQSFLEFAASANPDDEGAPVEDEAPDEEAPEPDEDAPRATAAEDVAAVTRERDELRHKLLSGDGRVSALQRKINDLQGRLQQAGPTGPSEEDAEEVRQLKEDYPDIANAVQRMLDGGYARIRAELQQEVEPIRQDNEQRAARELTQAQYQAMDQVSQAHADWREVSLSEPFLNWVAGQPVGLQHMYTSPDPRDAIFVLDQYKGANKPTPAQGDTARADEIEDRRQRNLANARSVTSRRTVRPTNEPPEDFDGAFQWHAAQQDLQAGR